VIWFPFTFQDISLIYRFIVQCTLSLYLLLLSYKALKTSLAEPRKGACWEVTWFLVWTQAHLTKAILPKSPFISSYSPFTLKVMTHIENSDMKTCDCHDVLFSMLHCKHNPVWFPQMNEIIFCHQTKNKDVSTGNGADSGDDRNEILKRCLERLCSFITVLQ